MPLAAPAPRAHPPHTRPAGGGTGRQAPPPRLRAPDTRSAALAALPRVCRTGTHLFRFAEDVKAFRGWGRGLRRAVGDWYAGKEPGELAYQLTKYQRRNGWSHRDLLRLTHP